MASKMVTDRQKSAEAVAAIGQAQTAELAAVLEDVLELDGPIALDALLQRLSEAVLGARQTMVSRDAAHEIENADDAQVRAARDEAASTLTSNLVELRELVTGLYGRDAAGAVFTSATPSDPVALARFGVEVADHLEQTAFGPSRLPGANLDPATIAAQLRTQSQTLSDRLADVARELRESQTTLVLKTEAIANYDRVFTSIATVFEGLFILAFQPGLAARVRPSRRRPGQTAQAQPDETTGE